MYEVYGEHLYDKREFSDAAIGKLSTFCQLIFSFNSLLTLRTDSSFHFGGEHSSSYESL